MKKKAIVEFLVALMILISGYALKHNIFTIVVGDNAKWK